MAEANFDYDREFEYSSSWPSEVRSIGGDDPHQNERLNPFNDSDYGTSSDSPTLGFQRDCQSLNGDMRSSSFNAINSNCGASDDSLMLESHFEEPLAFVNRNSPVDHIEAAVMECKRMFLGEIDDPVRKQRILKRLIELRQDLHFRKEEKRNPRKKGGTQTTLGHQLSATISPSLWFNCEVCRKPVRGHRFLYCLNCPVVCHTKYCREQMTRRCPAAALMDVEETLITGRPRSQSRCDTQLELDNAFLAGNLGAQDFLCAECRTPLCPQGEDVSGRSNQIRICRYTHKYFCSRCHWGDQWYIPAAVFVLNDTNMHPVSRSIYLKLKTLWSRAIFRVPEYWNTSHPSAQRVFSLRISLCKMQPYFALCPAARECKDIIDRTDGFHLQEQPFSMKMENVMQILDSTLIQKLTKYFNDCDTHIRNCNLCLVRNTLCHICGTGNPLFTYDPEVVYCSTCSKYFHGACATSAVTNERTSQCKACAKRRQKLENSSPNVSCN